VDYEIQKNIVELGLKDVTLIPGHITKSEAIISMLLSSVLLLLLNKAENVKGRLPGKIYEYLRSYKKILALGPSDSDVNDILIKTNSGKCIDYENSEALREFILSAYESWKNNIKSGIRIEEIKKFDVKLQTKYLSELLNEIVRK
jgi:hypothetical protein